MIYTLTLITERSKYVYYHVCCTFSDGRIQYLQMGPERTGAILSILIVKILSA